MTDSKNSLVYPLTPGDGVTFPPFTPTFPTPTYPTYDPVPAVATNYIQYAGRPIVKSLNGVVLCEPFKTNTVKKKERNGFSTIDQKVTLTPLMVLVGCAEIPTGSTVYVRAEACQSGWGKETFESDTIPQFIRVPLADIVFMKGYDTNPYYGGTWINAGGEYRAGTGG
jgi:hypothetical protein